MPDQSRAVWLTREQRDRLYDAHFLSIAYAWDAAPADPAVALDGPLRQVLPTSLMATGTRLSIAQHLLRALGYPHD